MDKATVTWKRAGEVVWLNEPQAWYLTNDQFNTSVWDEYPPEDLLIVARPGWVPWENLRRSR